MLKSLFDKSHTTRKSPDSAATASLLLDVSIPLIHLRRRSLFRSNREPFVTKGTYQTGSRKVFDKVFSVVSEIPKGKVLTYKIIADILNIPNVRIIGFALHLNRDPENFPCHRVVKCTGLLSKGYAFGGPVAQRKKLIKEGVRFKSDNQVDLESSLWDSYM